MKKMKASLKSIKNNFLTRAVIPVVTVAMPLIAHADEWDQKANQMAQKIQVGLYLIGGTMAGVTMLWKGIQWLIARSNGDHSVTFLDYLKQGGAIAAVGGGIVLATALWQYFA